MRVVEADVSPEPWEHRPRRGRRPGAAFTTRVLLVWLVGVTVVVTAAGYVTGQEWRLVPFLVFLPAVAAGVATVGQTAFAAAWAAVAEAVTLLHRPLPTVSANLSLLAFPVLFGLLSVAGCRTRIRREEEIARLRSTTVALQRQLLSPLPLRTAHVRVDGVYRPAEAEGMVGGDVYEVVETPFGTRVIIADVQGKGMPAIGTAFAVLGAFREAAHGEPDLVAVAQRLDSAVERHHAHLAFRGADEAVRAGERFVTALLLTIGEGADAQIVDCGHIPPYLLWPGRVTPLRVRVPGVPLGLAGLSPVPRDVERLPFPPDATVLLCTDGVSEARNAAGRFYPLRDRLMDLSGLAGEPSGRLAAALDTDVHQFTGGAAHDDIALLTLRRTPRSPARKEQ